MAGGAGTLGTLGTLGMDTQALGVFESSDKGTPGTQFCAGPFSGRGDVGTWWDGTLDVG